MHSPRTRRHVLAKNLFNSLYQYSKYASIITKAVDKIFLQKIALFRATEAVSSGIFEICEFISSSSLLSEYDNISILDGIALEIIVLLQDKFNKHFLRSTNNYTYYECKIINKKIIVSYNTYRNELSEAFCNKEETEDVANELAELFWKTYTNNVIIGYSPIRNRYDGEASLVVRPDDLSIDWAYHSKEYYEAEEYIKKFYDKGKNRAIIFYGNPGVGKSTVIKQIAKTLNIKTMRINIDSFKDFDIEDTIAIATLLKPQSLILDDFDRIEMSPSMLPIFEKLHRQLKLTMISVNSLDYFDKNKALIRPERFDKFIKINRLDDAVIEKIIGTEYMYLSEKVKDFPAAFIRELKENIEVFGNDCIDKCIEELRERVDYQNKEKSIDSENKENKDV